MIHELFGGGKKLPTILEAEQSECGLACIAMVASYFGARTDLNALRRTYPISAKGSNIQELMAIADALKLNTRAFRLELKDLNQLSLPAIIHWDMKHFVVLKAVKKHKIVIHDPAVGPRDYEMAETGKHFTGIALELWPAKNFERYSHVLTTKLSELFERFPGFNTAVAQLFLFSLMIQLIAIATAFYMQFVIDEAVAKQDASFLASIAIAFLVITLLSVGMKFVRSRIQMYFSNQLGFQMVGNVFNHLMSLPTDFFEKRHVGDLVSRFGSIHKIRRMLTEDLITVFLDGLLAIVTLGVMFYFSPTLALVACLFVASATAIKLLLIPAIRSLQEQKLIADAKSSTNLMENMRTIETIKFYCREMPRLTLWRNIYANQINANVKLTRLSINVEALYGALYGIENILLIFIAASFVLEGKLTIGFLTAFVALKNNFSDSKNHLWKSLSRSDCSSFN
jgi:ATP-binding cassette subfamily B protein RaxB